MAAGRLTCPRTSARTLKYILHRTLLHVLGLPRRTVAGFCGKHEGTAFSFVSIALRSRCTKSHDVTIMTSNFYKQNFFSLAQKIEAQKLSKLGHTLGEQMSVFFLAIFDGDAI